MGVKVPFPHARGGAIRAAACMLVVGAVLSSTFAAAQSRNRAPGFETMRKDGAIVVMPTDIELFEISAGGIPEPKAEWTDTAHRHFRTALRKKQGSLGVKTLELGEKHADELAEINVLHAAVARSISLHHFGPDGLRLPTKDGKLDWSMGEPVRAIRQKTGADYALFTWIRDSYASPERVAMMIAFALLRVGLTGGVQVGYASLVDLETGQVLWFNHLVRPSGDLREAEKAAETLDTLLADFPDVK